MNNKMYINYSKVSGATIYLNDCMYIIQTSDLKNLALQIKNIAEKENAVIYIDISGFGLGLYDELSMFENLIVNPLKIIKQIFDN